MQYYYRFTSAIRTAIKMNGTEQITLGGGEEIWLYVNQILVLQVHGVSSGATPCKTISLADGVGKSRDLVLFLRCVVC